MANNLQRALRNANRSTINKVLAKARTATSKAVREVYNIKAGELNKVIKLRRASNQRLQGVISVKTRKTSLIKFAARPRKINKRLGVTVKVKRTGARKLVMEKYGGFIGTAKGTTAKQIFIRQEDSRLPIDKKFTLSVSQMVERAGETELNKTIQKDLPRIQKSELNEYIRRELRR